MLKRVHSVFIAVALVIPVAHVTTAAEEVSAASSTKYVVDGTTRPFGAISVIGDSVMLGSLTYGPTLVEQLAVPCRRRDVVRAAGQISPQPLHQVQLFSGRQAVEGNIHAYRMSSESP